MREAREGGRKKIVGERKGAPSTYRMVPHREPPRHRELFLRGGKRRPICLERLLQERGVIPMEGGPSGWCQLGADIEKEDCGALRASFFRGMEGNRQN